jgi:hypothetical protein
MFMNKAAIGAILSLTLTFSFLFAPPTFAKEEPGTSLEESGALRDDPFLTPELEKEMEELEKEKEKEMAPMVEELKDANGPLRTITGPVSWPVVLQKQIKKYYCGPAAARVTLSFHQWKSGSKNALPSQTELAKKMETEKYKATSSILMVKALNSYSGRYGKFKYASKKYDKVHPYADWAEKVSTAILGKVNSPINLVDTTYMDRYREQNNRIRHYINISGWNAYKTVRTNDPHYNNRFYGSRWEAVGSGAKNGIFKASWEADKQGDNHALIR